MTWIEKYASFFHDGSIEKIIHTSAGMQLWMESAEMRSEWNRDRIVLSKRNTISGKLFLSGIKSIKENESTSIKVFHIKNTYENGVINRFKINSSTVFLQIRWVKYDPEYEESRTFMYEIKADRVQWENIPTLFDAYWDSL